MNRKNVSLAEKIALFDCNIWPKMQFTEDSYILTSQQRLIGNEHYRRRQFEEAIVAYNHCLYSTLEDRGIAYANRAAAYLAMRSYQDCLKSVRLAKDCPLPANTLAKVLAREKMAFEGLEMGGVANVVEDTILPVQLSYRRNNRMPSFVFCLKLKDAVSPYGGIATSENILPGDVLVVEPPLTTFAKLNPMCDYCCGTSGSLQPCNCELVLFCSAKCKEKSFEEYHNFECPLMAHLLAFAHYDCLVLRVFFKLIQRFACVATLREYLGNIKNPNPFDNTNFKEWSDSGSFVSQFRLYYATERAPVINCATRKDYLFRTDIDNTNMNASMAKAAIIIEMLKTCQQIPRIAKSTDEWSYLSDLLFHLMIFKSFAVINCLIRPVIKYAQDDDYGIELKITEDSRSAICAFHGSASLFRTSCQPNVCMTYVENLLIVRAIKYIPRGTELLAPQS